MTDRLNYDSFNLLINSALNNDNVSIKSREILQAGIVSVLTKAFKSKFAFFKYVKMQLCT